MGDFSCVLALNAAFAEIIIPVVTCYTFDIGIDPDLLRISTVNFQYTHQHMISHGKAVIGIADPVPRKVTGQNRRLHAKYFDPDDPL